MKTRLIVYIILLAQISFAGIFSLNLSEEQKLSAIKVLKDNKPSMQSEKKLNDLIHSHGEKSDAPNAVLYWAESYLDNDLVQEAVWLLRKYGLSETAESLENQLIQIMEGAKPTFVRRVGAGVSGGEVVKIAGKINAIRKNIKEANNEVFAYRLSRLLDFDLVPVTVFQGGNNSQVSLQYMLDGASDSKIDFRSQVNEYSQYPELYAFDYLLANQDRHWGNSMFIPSGKLVAIDHSHVMLQFPHAQGVVPGSKYLKPEKIASILNLDPAVASILKAEDKSGFESRLSLLQRLIANREGQQPQSGKIKNTVNNVILFREPDPEMPTLSDVKKLIKDARRNEDERIRQNARTELVKIFSNVEWAKTLVPDLAKYARLASVIAKHTKEFPVEFLILYRAAVESLDEKDEAHVKVLELLSRYVKCEAKLAI